MRKLLLSIPVALALVFGFATPAQAATTITLDADGARLSNGQILPTAEAAADWSKNTDVTVVAGECTTGKYCVHFKIVDGFPCGKGVAGCAYGIADGSCQVELSKARLSYVVTHNRIWLDDLLVKHEAGHCIFRAGGIAQSYHLPDPGALMYFEQPSNPTRQEATLSNADRTFTRTLF